MRQLLAALGVLIAGTQGAFAAGEIGFVEDYVLSQDRAGALSQLIPGTEDYYYFHSLHYLSTEQFDKVVALQAPWVQRHGETARVWEIRTRYALLTYDRNPQASLEHIQRRLGLSFPHQKEDLSAEPNFPTKLDAALISREQFINRANAVTQDNLDGFEDSALDWLTSFELNPNHRRSLLARLARPDYPNLVKLVVADLNHENSGGFGSLGIHRQMLLPQLEELVKLKPELLNHLAYVQAYLAKIQPGADEDWRNDPARQQAHLDRLAALARRLDPVHNSLKSHVLYHQLVLDRQQGKLSKERFVEYLKLPRPVGYAARAFLESEPVKRFPCDLNANYDGLTLLPPVGNDEPLVRAYLLHFLRDAADAREFEPYINDVYLKYLLAEVKITNGLGNVEQWASLLPPELYQQLKDRIDLDFASTNPVRYTVDQPVVLDVAVKNVPTLIVKVFEINTGSFYRDQLREVDTDINLDGLVANSEKTYKYNEPAVRRVVRRFEFPELTKAGVYVIDFIGNGKSSRALIRKGRLQHVVRTGPAGQVFTVYNEQRQPVRNATLWLAGREYRANDKGLITVPFSTSPGRFPIVLSQGEFSCLDYFVHEGETYQLTAGIYVDREALLTRKQATVLVRPGLTLNGTPAAIKLLEEVKFQITSTDLDGIATSQEVPNFVLFEDRETVHEFQVPARTASVTFTLTAQVKRLSAGGEKQSLAVANSFTLNEIERTDKTEDLHFIQTDQGYALDLYGKTGESKASRPVTVTFKHRDFRQPVGVTLKTDPQGRIELGVLTDIVTVTANGPQGIAHTWPVRPDQHTFSQLLHGRAGEVLTVPFLPRPGGELSPGEVSLLELRGDLYTVNRFDALKLRDGLLRIEGLPAGDYDLFLKWTGARIRVRISAGEQQGAYVIGPARVLETRPLTPLQIASIDNQAEHLSIRLSNVSKFARVHVFATRFVPEYPAFDNLARVRAPEPYLFNPGSVQTVYITGRNIGDEYSYILNRQQVAKLPGNMLERPSLLLNPWAVRDTQTGEQVAAGGDAFLKAGAPAPSAAERPNAMAEGQAAAAGNFANLDFLANTSAVLVNLLPDDQGLVEIPLAELGPHQNIVVVACDPLNTTLRSVALKEHDLLLVDQRLVKPLDSQAHFTQQKQISVVTAAQPFVLEDITTSRFELYDSLARVYSLYTTLSNDPKLAEFAPVLTWPKMSPEERRAFYSKNASHELTFFLAKKDPEFFQTVIRPYLANKRDKTFLDHWLLGDDLTAWLQPWNFEQLNVVERILLAQRLEGERPATARHVSDLYQLLPPNPDRFLQLFDTAVKGSALSTQDGLGLQQALGELREKAAAKGEASQEMFLGRRAGGMPGGGGGGRGAALPGIGGPRAPREEEVAEARKSAENRPARAKLFARDGAADKKQADRAAEAGDTPVQLSDSVALEFLDAGIEERLEGRALYRQPEKTREWAENNYHHLTIDQQHGGLITVNAFWRDYARHDPAQPFQSRNLADASRNFPEMLLALAVLDLPFESPKHETKFDGTRMTLQPGGPLVVFHEEIRAAQAKDQATKILVGQTYFKHGERHMQVDGEQVDKYVTEEFLIHTVYGCQVVITNPNSSRQKLSVLLQIPQGAIPVLNGKPTKTLFLTLEPYHTQTIDYYFYFPAAGQFPHFPVQVARSEELVAFAAPFTFNVVDKPTRIDTKSWDYVSQFGSSEEVLAFLNANNVAALNFDRIAWRMHDAKFFETASALLAARHAYNHTLWSYAIKHNAVAAAREFLQHADGFVNECGGRLTSRLLTIDPVARRTYEHLEYKPLVNARAHALGRRRQIVNDRFHGQYHRWLAQAAYDRELSNDDLMAATYYLLLQDRVEEARGLFARVKPEALATRMQYDYCAAYLDFFNAQPAQARAIALKYADHPVDRWRHTFEVILAQLDEAEGKDAKAVDPLDRAQQQGQLAATEPSFEFQVEAKEIALNYQNLGEVRVNYYLMDVELLFSRNPFVQQFRGQFSAIRPNRTEVIRLADGADANAKPGSGARKIPLPEELRNKNILVEIVGAGQSRTQAYYSHSLSVQVIENYGQVRVTHQGTGKPVPKAYVKVYTQLANGQVKFYKDGYTDLRGRFDYASLSTNDLDTAGKFSILIMSDEHGAVVREATPPKR